MRILIINCNPKLDFSSAEWFYTPFFRGLKENGASIKKLYLTRKNLHHCKGCLNCWFTHSGQCVIKDDFAAIFEQIISADYIFLVTPLYVGNFPTKTLCLFQRMTSAINPDYSFYNGHYGHTLLRQHDIKGIGLISWCGFHEIDNFDPVISQIKTFSYCFSIENMINIVRPHINYFKFFPEDKIKYEKHMHTAGCQFAKNRTINTELKAEIEKDLIDTTNYFALINEYLMNKTKLHDD